MAAVLQKHAFSDRLIGSGKLRLNGLDLNQVNNGDLAEEQNLLVRTVEVLFSWPGDIAVASQGMKIYAEHRGHGRQDGQNSFLER